MEATIFSPFFDEFYSVLIICFLLLVCMFVYDMYVGMSMPQHTYEGQMTSLWSQFSASILHGF